MQRGSAHLELADEGFGLGPDPTIDQEAHCPGQSTPERDAGVLEHRMYEDQPLPLPVFAHVADAVAMDGVGDGADPSGFARDLDRSRRDREQTDDRLGEFRSSRPDEAVEPDDLAASDPERDVAMAERRRELVEFEHRRGVAAIAGAPVGNLLGSTDHQPHEVLAIEACHAAALAGVAAVAQDRDGIADRLHLLELVADEQHADAVVA